VITLLAEAPYGPYAADLEQFGRLAGLWRTSITVHPADGSPPRHAQGEWEFGYALEGRAVIDVWQVPPRDQLVDGRRQPNQEIGLCVRIWDPRLQLWRFTFHGTAYGTEVQMFAREIGDEMVLERADGGRLTRWTFSEFDAASFSWRSEISTDGGGSWQLEQGLTASRQTRRQKGSR
jgi:hypothetical protein